MRKSRGYRASLLAAALLTVASGAFTIYASAEDGPSPQKRSLSAIVAAAKARLGEYKGSENCAKCHPHQYERWHHSYHRSMTQLASRESIQGDFNDHRVDFGALSFRFYWEGEHAYVELSEPEHGVVQRQRVDQVTGSHHLQVYSTLSENGQYSLLPMAWLIPERRWMRMSASFLAPDEGIGYYADAHAWNNRCALCHTTRPVPGTKLVPPGKLIWETEMVERGIACGACHGESREHWERNHNPLYRSWLQLFTDEAPKIRNPAKMSAERSVTVCARCHCRLEPRPEIAQMADFVGLASKNLIHDPLDSVFVMPSDDRVYDASLDEHRNAYYPDWTPRSTGKEYEGISQSACYAGELSCLTCHTMHAYADRDDQLVPRPMQSVCLDCHPQFASTQALEAHTHHSAKGAGSKCVNCHMPPQNYGLFTSIRNHRIDSPALAQPLEAERPLACTQCHVERDLRWAGEQLNAWCGQGGELPKASHLPQTLLELAEGNALLRAHAVSSLGRIQNGRPALKARIPYLLDALDDEYPAVRAMAHRALRRFPAYRRTRYWFDGPREQRAREIRALRKRSPVKADPESWRRFLEAKTRRDHTELHIAE